MQAGIDLEIVLLVIHVINVSISFSRLPLSGPRVCPRQHVISSRDFTWRGISLSVQDEKEYCSKGEGPRFELQLSIHYKMPHLFQNSEA